MRDLGLPAGVDDVHLRRDLVAGSEPGLADQRQRVVGVVVDEHLGRLQRQLVQGSPDPIIGARLGEVVTRSHARLLLLGDHRLELLRRPIHHRRVERLLEHQHAGAFEECSGELGLQGAASVGSAARRTQVLAVDQDVLLDRVGERVVGQLGRLLDEHPEVLEAAIVGIDPAG